jgi:hypothetical protein
LPMSKINIKVLIICTLGLLLYHHVPAYSNSPARNDDQNTYLIKGPVSIGDSLFQEGVNAYRLNHYSEANELLNKALELAEISKDTLLKAKCLERLGSLNLALGDDFLALKLYYEALSLFEQKADKEGIAKVYNIIGLYKSSQDENDSAIAYFLKAIELNTAVKNQTGIIHNKGNLGYLYQTMGDYASAKSLYLELIDLLISMKDSLNLPVIYNDLALLYNESSKPDSAYYFLNKAITLCEMTRDTSFLTSVYSDYGDLDLSVHKYSSANSMFYKSMICAQAINDFSNEVKALKNMMFLDSLNGNYNAALEKSAKILVLKDSVYARKLKNNMENSELKYENQKKNNLIEIQKVKFDNEHHKREFILVLFMISVVSIIFLFMIIFLIIKNNRKNSKIICEELRSKELKLDIAAKDEMLNMLKIEKLEDQITIKEKEQVSTALSLEQKNELLGMINVKINEAMQSSGEISILELNGIVSKIKQQIKDNSDYDVFNEKFSRLHNSFYNDLKKAHPELTKSELKFCAYLRLNLSSQQIANIMNVSFEAIRKNRYRIRKKLKLLADESLEGYISKF